MALFHMMTDPEKWRIRFSLVVYFHALSPRKATYLNGRWQNVILKRDEKKRNHICERERERRVNTGNVGIILKYVINFSLYEIIFKVLIHMHVQQSYFIQLHSSQSPFSSESCRCNYKNHRSVMCIIVHIFITRIDSKSCKTKQEPNYVYVSLKFCSNSHFSICPC